MDAMPIVVTMITVGLTLVFAVAGAAWHVGMRLGTVQRGVADADEYTRELRTDVREMRAESRSDNQELRTEIEQVRTAVRADVQQVRTEVHNLRTDMTAEIQHVRSDVTTEIQQVRTEVKADSQRVRTEVRDLRTEVKADFKELRADVKADMQEMRADVKADEVRRACALLGVEEIHFFGADDAVLRVTEEAVRRLARLVRELRPDVVLTHFPKEGDGLTNAHAICGQIVLHALALAYGGSRRQSSAAPSRPGFLFRHWGCLGSAQCLGFGGRLLQRCLYRHH